MNISPWYDHCLHENEVLGGLERIHHRIVPGGGGPRGEKREIAGESKVQRWRRASLKARRIKSGMKTRERSRLCWNHQRAKLPRSHWSKEGNRNACDLVMAITSPEWDMSTASASARRKFSGLSHPHFNDVEPKCTPSDEKWHTCVKLVRVIASPQAPSFERQP